MVKIGRCGQEPFRSKQSPEMMLLQQGAQEPAPPISCLGCVCEDVLHVGILQELKKPCLDPLMRPGADGGGEVGEEDVEHGVVESLFGGGSEAGA